MPILVSGMTDFGFNHNNPLTLKASMLWRLHKLKRQAAQGQSEQIVGGCAKQPIIWFVTLSAPLA